ncbi:MAG: peptidoglycan-binding domain-containing protein [Pseudomonadota bacterium]
MSLVRVRLLTVAIAVMFGSVAFNLFAMQGTNVGLTVTERVSTAAGRATDPTNIGATVETGAAPQPKPLMGRQARGVRGLVQAIQRELVRHGYRPGATDGVAGLATQAAVLAYQYDHGLPLTATASDDLLEALILGLPRSPGGPARTYSAEAQMVVRTVQSTLAALGHSVGGIDGKLGPMTRAAIRKFEGNSGLPITGRISGRLIQAFGTQQITANRRRQRG